ncbi:hypothetical protein BUALT_Bualt17G0110800 [Buddleja alternifolia]|uniref:Chlororespiratory reduction 3 n=1 Tax=Buddleja alternifolia TaxID=168488 RepID=A0AAV6WD69_9LAMI|nr:hypothetical protein BUALT_Bualt17G0110800 [Buddleja alternifolia]
MAAILSCHSITKHQILASSALHNDDSSSCLPPTSQFKPSKLPKTYTNVKLEEKLKQKQGQQQPSILEIERAIGAGIFRDRDEEEKSNNLFDNILRNSVGKNEGSVEKKLRESGEWLIDQTERTSRSAGKQILMTIFVWIIPMWISAFLVAAGIVQLPFLDDFIS